MFNNSSDIYTYNDIEQVLDERCKYVNFVPNTSKKKENKVYYLNCPIAFDIETTSTEQDETKIAFMYHWQFGINGAVFFGRTWTEFTNLMERISSYFDLDEQHRIIIYVHNLAYEFQFISKFYEWTQVFALDERRPAKAVTKQGIELRCSYILSGMSLDNMGKSLLKYKVLKMKDDLDYSLIRHSTTPLTEKELKYCENDVRVVMAYIQNKIEEDGSIGKILLTKTSYVRKYVRSNTIYNKNPIERKKYKTLMEHLTLTPEEYIMAKRAFQGGFTHANVKYVDQTIENVDSIDFTSSYPASMIAFPYPMSKGRHIEPASNDEAMKWINSPYYLSMFDIKFEGLRAKPTVYDNILSLSKCFYADGTPYKKADALTNNGRIVMAYDDIYTTMTNVDLKSINDFYDYDDFTITDMYVYKADYLPKTFLECVIHFYKGKTELKNVEGRESEYNWHKANLNSTFGMAVTDICRDSIDYSESWSTDELDVFSIMEKIDDYNKSPSRFLSYIWGVFITAYSRANVYTGILEFGEDYLYCDTDSNKVKNFNNHLDYINRYNKWITERLQNTMKHYNLNPDDINPADTKGIRHPLGVWDHETENNQYLRFKTLGAKRYLVEQKDGLHMTVAGLPKSTIKNLNNKYDDVFEAFNNGLVVNPEETTKNCLCYVDGPCEGTITDYLGTTGYYKEKSYVHMESIGFEFNRDLAYIDYILLNMKQERSYE